MEYHMKEEKTSMIFRIDPDLKKAFERVAENMDMTASQLLRGFVRDTVAQNAAKNAQSDLFKPPAAPKPVSQVQTSKKTKKPPLESKEGLLALFKPKR
jgi:hypothetical protein